MMQLSSFYRGACVVLGALLGVLIVFPMTMVAHLSPPLATLALVIGVLLGAAIGYRRGESRAFLYFLLLSVGLLSTVLVRQLP